MSSGFGMDARLGSLLQPIALSVLAFGLGYQVHSYTSRRTLSSTASASIPKPTRSRSSSTSSNESHIEAEDSDSEAEDEKAALISDLTSVKATMLDEIKLVLVVNDSLKMSKGKIAAQAGHATLACAFMLNEIHPRLFSKWKRQGQPKIALRCSDTEELETLAAQARSLNLCARTIQDAGRTQVAAGSKTILGIGPGPARLINQITGKLKLL